MAYGEFTIASVQETFNLSMDERQSLFADVQPTEQLYIQAPVMTIIEAKNENIIGGLGQCIASMVAAQIFNQQSSRRIHKPIHEIYGAVTTGTNWRFLKLKNQTVLLDKTEYYIRDIDKILGILIYPWLHCLEAIA
ncbi:MAG: hypothetical protein ACFB8W_17015 [Elainellaceae cyanobacterium]